MRSAHNVGSLIRTAEGLGVSKLILSGYTPYPLQANDQRLPHIAQKVHQRITKTSLSAEQSIECQYIEDIQKVISELKASNYQILSLEQSPTSVPLPDINVNNNGNFALILGNEVSGIDQQILDASDQVLEIPMRGNKESFNVVEAATMAMYQTLLVSGGDKG